MSCSLRFAGIVSPNPFVQIFAGSYVASSSPEASQNITVKHRLEHWPGDRAAAGTVLEVQVQIGVTGFEPATCRRGDRSTGVHPVHISLCRSCKSVLSPKLLGALRNSRFESVSTARRAWWLSTPRELCRRTRSLKPSHDPTQRRPVFRLRRT